MKVEKIGIDKLTPYVRNAKKHPPEQIEQIKKSILNFGNNDPIAIDEEGVILAGHGRFEALKSLGYTEVEVIKLTHLSEQQKKAYILAHNQLTMNSGWDDRLLKLELEAIDEFDMGDFDFDLPELEEKHERTKVEVQHRKANILNLEVAEYVGAGKYDIPEIIPVKKMPKIDRWIRFDYMLSDKSDDKKHTGVHFFADDYKFERVWNSPDEYIPKLKQYGVVLSPDFSPYGDMPLITQMWNHYRKHWCARYWQDNGILVVPTIRASTDPRSLEWYLDGEPHNSIVCISNMWTSQKRYKDGWECWLKEYQTMVDTLNPSKILIYGTKTENVTHKNVEIIKTFANEKWGK